MQDLAKPVNQPDFDPNFRQTGSDVPQLPASVSNFPGGKAAYDRGGG